jgi:hypothetical protein
MQSFLHDGSNWILTYTLEFYNATRGGETDLLRYDPPLFSERIIPNKNSAAYYLERNIMYLVCLYNVA